MIVRWRHLAIAGMLVVSACNCGRRTAPLDVICGDATIPVGGTTIINLEHENPFQFELEVEISSSDESVATVDIESYEVPPTSLGGMNISVTGVAPGMATIGAGNGFEGGGSCEITVVEPGTEQDAGPGQNCGNEITVFDDSDFAEAEWTQAVMEVTSSDPALFETRQETTDGNPGNYRWIRHEYGLDSILIEHFPIDGTIDPANGAICGISWSADLIHIIDPPSGQQVAFRLLLRQDGVYYVGELFAISGDNTWTSFSSSMTTEAGFSRIQGTGPDNPDFGTTGSPIDVGFMSANTSTTSTENSVRVSGIDNWRVEIGHD